MAYKSEIINMATTALQRKDYGVFEAIFRHLAPNVGQESDQVLEDLKDLALELGDQRIIDIVLDNTVITESKAVRYLQSRIKTPGLDRGNLDLMLKSLKETTGALLGYAIRNADFELIDKLLVHETLVTPMAKYYQHKAWNINQYWVPRDMVKSALEYHELKAIIDAAGKAGLISENTLGIDEECFIEDGFLDIVNFPKCHQGSEMPVVNNGKISQPELLIAFAQHLDNGNFHSSAYKRIPVLIATEQLAAYSSAAPVSKEPVIALRKPSFSEFDPITPVSITYESLGYFKAKKSAGFSKNHSRNFSHLDFEFECQNHNNTHRDLCDKAMLISMIDIGLLYGLTVPEGYTLAMVDTEQLRHLSLESADACKLAQAMEWASNALCRDVLKAHFLDASSMTLPALGRGMASSRAMALNFADEQKAMYYISLFGKDLLKEMIGNNHKDLPAKSYINMQNLLGMHQEVVQLKDLAFLDELHSLGYMKSPDSRFSTSLEIKSDLEGLQKIIAMGGWPSTEVKKPETVLDGLRQAVNKSNLCLKAFLLNEGLESVCAVAKTEAQWKAITNIFQCGFEDLSKYKLPNSVKKHLIEQDFGI